jgi:hypothetical protein
MTVEASDFAGRSTFVTGPDKGSGKTSFLNFALGLLRAEGESLGFLGIGLDGDGAQAGAAGRPVLVPCRAGELFLSAERYLADSGCCPEIVGALPLAGALGRLAVARARRDGSAVLVGPEGNDQAALAISMMREAGARSVLVDGAMNRITQVSTFAGARFWFVLRVEPATAERQARAMRRLAALASLPSGDTAVLPGPVARIDGPLTGAALSRVPESARSVVVEDFTKVFLDWRELSSLMRSRTLAASRGPEFGGFAVSLRDMSREDFARRLDDPAIEAMTAFDPYGARIEASHA